MERIHQLDEVINEDGSIKGIALLSGYDKKKIPVLIEGWYLRGNTKIQVNYRKQNETN